MKKIVLILLLNLTMVSASFSQFGNLRLGLKASPSLSWFRPETRGYSSEGTKLGFSFGANADYRLGDFYAFSSGLHISSIRGALSYVHEIPFNESIVEGILERHYNLRFLEVPLTVKMHTDQIGYSTYFARFGFSPGFVVRARANDDFLIAETSTRIIDEDLEINDQVSFFRLALVVGLGMEYSLGGQTALVAGITFNNGFTNILSGENVVTGRRHSAVSNFFELTLGIMF
jgi:hypothetical protein